MQIHTRPVPCPKPVCASQSAALESGALVDLAEFDRPGLQVADRVLPCAVSEALMALVETIPFAQIGSSSWEERLSRLVERAEAALQRAAESLGARFIGAVMYGFAVDFAAELPCHATDRLYRFVRMHCATDERGELLATLLCPEERPVEGTSAR